MLLTIFPTLAQAAIREKQSKPFWLWTVLRALDKSGQGWVLIEDVQEIWKQSNRNLSRIISEGEDIFWNTSNGRLFMRSAQNVGIELESGLGAPSQVPFDSCSTIGKFRHQCLAAFFWKERTISVGTLAELYGVSESTVQNWTKKAGLSKETNIAYCEPPEDGLGMPSHTDGGVWFSGGLCYFQIPNSYCNRSVETCVRHRKTEKRIRQALHMDEGRCAKVFFRDYGKLTRALQGGQKQAWMQEDSSWHGRRLWCYYAMP